MPTYDSALSAEVQATTLLPAPTLDTVTTDATSAGLAWTATHTNGNTRVEYRDSDDTTWITDQTVGFATETATITGLDNGTTYDFRVVATTADADSPSNTLSDTTTLPDEDQPILGNGVKDEIAVDRETAVSNAGDVRYQLRRTEDAPDWETAPSFQEFVGAFDTLTFEFVGLLDGEEYEVRGRTETADATGAFTDPVSIVTKFPAITGLAASLDDATGDVTLTWTDNADNEDGIEVQRRELSTDSGTPTAYEVVATLAPDTETYTDNVDAGEYEYRLRAFTPYTDAFSETTVTVLRPTQVGGVDGWQVVAANQTDPETNVAPRAVSAVYDVDPVVDTANPFGDYGVFKADDRGGEVFDRFPRGEQVEFYAPQETTPRLSGYVVERRENEQAGADALEVEVYSFDQFLRRNTVTNDQRGNTITQALADIIQTDTPVSYAAGNIDVGDDQTLTRSYQGEAVENALRDFAFKSNNEKFGVNDALEFFFRPRETEHIDRGIDNTEWFRYDIPELGKEAINEVEVWFDGGDESVIVDDGTDKLDLQDNLGLPSPGTQRAELNRPLVTDIADAEDIGRKYLKFRNSTLSGTVTTFGLYNAEPGDTIDITIDSRGIDSEFVIAGVEYRWGVDETILTIIERRGDVDDILTDLNDSVQRVEMEGANRDAPSNRITTTNAIALVDVSVDADGNTPDAVRYVNDGRRAVRDTWTGDAAPDITTLVVGDDGTGLSRSNDTLRNQTTSASVTQALPDAASVEFTASVTQSGVQELGLETADGRLITRAVFASPVDLNGTVTVTLGVSNDASVSRGIITTNGQTAVRDVLADNAPALPNAYAYGRDGTAVSESDTALGDEAVEVSLEDVLIRTLGSDNEWSEGVDEPFSTLPLAVTGGELATQQIAWTREAENADASDEGATIGPDDASEFSNGDYIAFAQNGDFAEYDFTVGYDNTSDLKAQIRYATDTDGEGSASFDAVLIDPNGAEQDRIQIVADGSTLSSPIWSSVNVVTAPLEPGEWTLRLECTTSSTALDDGVSFIDVVAPYDSDYESDIEFPDTLNANGYLSGPEKFPALIEADVTTTQTRRNITEARVESTFNDTSNNQFIEARIGSDAFTRANNTDTLSITGGPDRGLDVRFGLSRFGQTGATPTNGANGQSVDIAEFFANPDAVTPDDIGETVTRGVVPPGTLTGETIREAGLKHAATDTLLSRHEIAEFTVESGQRIASAETTQFTGDN